MPAPPARRRPCALLGPLVLAACAAGPPAEAPAEPPAAKPGAAPAPTAAETPARAAAGRMDWWREARFGLFVHWGLYALPAGVWGEETGHAEWIRTTARIPRERYERLAAELDPPAFDADAWVRLAQRAGMRYVVITTKHHDGFALFDSAHSAWDVGATPFGRDVMAEIADACRRAGLRVGWYHSIMDWHHPDYLPRRGWETDRPTEGADFARYVRYLHAQVTELLERYGPIGVMWFDGEWEATWTHEHGVALYELCRRLQPDVIVNNRVDKGRGGMAGLTTDERYVGDFGTPEQEIPATGLPGVDWETCMTMNDHWGWNAHDERWKSAEDLVAKLVDVASKGGNFLLNVGPRADGSFPPEAVERLEAIGRWMDVNGAAIHGTEASPFDALPWGRCTVRRGAAESTLYLHVLAEPAGGRLVVPGLGNRVRRAFALAEPDRPLAVERAGGDVRVDLGGVPRDPACTVVALVLEGAPVVYRTPRIVAPCSVLVDELEVAIVGSPGLVLRYTLDGSEPTAGSPAYAAPLVITGTTVVRARAFHDGRPVSGAVERRFERVAPLAATAAVDAAPGLARERYAGEWDALPDFDALEPVEGGVAETVGLGDGPRGERVGLRLAGFVTVPETAVWAFGLDSDDGSRLLVDGRVVVDNDGLHGARELTGHVPLAAGAHAIEVTWFNKTGGAELALRWGRAGEPLAPVPAGALTHAPSSAR